MTAMESCDWHDEERCVPDHLTRRVISRQLRVARELAVTVERLLSGGFSIDTQAETFYAVDGHVERGQVTLTLGRFLALSQALNDWGKVAPRYAESYEGPTGPPAEIRVPPSASD